MSWKHIQLHRSRSSFDRGYAAPGWEFLELQYIAAGRPAKSASEFLRALGSEGQPEVRDSPLFPLYSQGSDGVKVSVPEEIRGIFPDFIQSREAAKSRRGFLPDR